MSQTHEAPEAEAWAGHASAHAALVASVKAKPVSQTHVLAPVVGSVEAEESAGHCALAATSASTSAAARSTEEEHCTELERCAEEERRAELECCAATRRSAAGFVMVCI